MSKEPLSELDEIRGNTLYAVERSSIEIMRYVLYFIVITLPLSSAIAGLQIAIYHKLTTGLNIIFFSCWLGVFLFTFTNVYINSKLAELDTNDIINNINK